MLPPLAFRQERKRKAAAAAQESFDPRKFPDMREALMQVWGMELDEGKVVFDDHDANDRDFVKLIKKHGLKAKSDGDDTTVTGDPNKIEKVLQTIYGNDWKDMYKRKGQNFENFAGINELPEMSDEEFDNLLHEADEMKLEGILGARNRRGQTGRGGGTTPRELRCHDIPKQIA